MTISKKILIIFLFAVFSVGFGISATKANSQSTPELEPEPYSYTSENPEDELSYEPVLEPMEPQASNNPTAIENQNPGSDNWILNKNGFKSSDDSNNQIKGYANKTSVNKGNSIDFKVTVNPAQNFRMEIYRIGWYQGLGGRLMKSVGPISGIKQSGCPMDSKGMVECKWTTSYTLNVPDDWVSGAYLVKLMNNRGYSNWINFTLREDERHSDILFQNSVNTWQAYNSWGGRSFYTSPAAVKISFDRPYVKSGSRLTSWELNMIHFLEKNGYDVTYNTNVDTDTSPGKLLNHKAFLSVGHDEYWTWEMRDSVENAIKNGTNVAFFGGNDAYWQVRYEKSSTGAANRVLVGYKYKYQSDPYYSSKDPEKRKRTTGQFRYSVSGRPEQKMIGTMYGRNLGTHDNNLPWTVQNENHWVYAGTDLKNGDKIPNVYGYEYNTIYSGYPKANGGTYTVLSKTNSSPDAYSTIYKAPSGAFVFSAGTTDWTWLLDKRKTYNFINPKAQQITKNILNKFIGFTPTPTLTPAQTLTPSPTLTPTQTPNPILTP
ncbi:MAG: hypothetical protein KBD51_02830 [Candidatus Levybacteria bacterium]|nr:hypothetical protein [Candidatus Levybacteria bacterium]